MEQGPSRKPDSQELLQLLTSRYCATGGSARTEGTAVKSARDALIGGSAEVPEMLFGDLRISGTKKSFQVDAHTTRQNRSLVFGCCKEGQDAVQFFARAMVENSGPLAVPGPNNAPRRAGAPQSSRNPIDS